MALSMAYLPMVVFLAFGTAANIPFLIRSIVDTVRQSALRRALPSAPPALLTTAIAECCWVLPCLVQCALTLFKGTGGPWAPSNSAYTLGCDIMGYYSTFASISGMLSTLWVTYITFKAVGGVSSVTMRTSLLVGGGVLAFSAFFTALPFMGVGSFEFTGEGFCYFNWHDKALATLMLLVTLPTMVASVTFLALTLKRGGWPSQLDLILMLFGFLSAWILWVPASIIGLSGAPFPTRYMISGGVMGHAQALLNPYIYGVRWRRSACALSGTKSETPAHTKVSVSQPSASTDVDETPSTVDVDPSHA